MNQYFEDLATIISFESVCDWKDKKYPYGAEIAKALDYVLDLCKGFGFRVKNADYKYAYVEIGHGDELIGILAHLDVVDQGDGWETPAFEACIRDERMYGRGISDDKGPLMACIYAMKDLLDSGIQLDKRIRLIIGMTEETGNWADIELYKQSEECPAYGFTPDGYFPLIYGEKGILHLKLTYHDKNGFDSLSGGNGINMVPAKAESILACGEAKIHVDACGKSAHASTPEEGENAISLLMQDLWKKDFSMPFVRFYHELFGMSYHGELCNCDLEDEASGKLTMNIGKVAFADSGIVLEIDIRYPVTYSGEQVLNQFEQAIRPYPCSVQTLVHMKPVYSDRNGKLIQTLYKVYESETDDHTEPLVVGGGTYARAMDNIVAFGPLLPYREGTEHQANEYMYVSDLVMLRRLYAKTLTELLNTEL